MSNRGRYPRGSKSKSSKKSKGSSKGRRVVDATQPPPSETSDSYFPVLATTPTPLSSSPLSSSASSSSETDEDIPTPVAKANQMIGTNYPIPPLERQYTPPAGELDVARQLAMKPLPRSLHSSLQRAATFTAKKPVEDEETRARKLADAKRQLLALAGQI